MRKLKGVIGAIVVVIALMGSVLAGFALNVNGSTEIVNAYEKVTDVSGLYSHSQEKTFIEYNPASNYIGYSTQAVKENPVNNPNARFKSITNGTITIDKNQGIKINDGEWYPVQNNTDYLRNWTIINDKALIYTLPSLTIWNKDVSHAFDIVIITVDLPNITFNVEGTQFTYNDSQFFMVYNPTDYDYIGMYSGDGGNRTIYLNDALGIYGLAFNTNLQHWGAFKNLEWSDIFAVNVGDIAPLSSGTQIAPNLKEYTTLSTYPGYSDVINITVYPRTVLSNTYTGIDYTESSRVNNYPIEYRSSSSTDTTTQQLDLQALATTDYWPQNENWIIDSFWNVGGQYYGSVIVMAPRFNAVGSSTFLNSIHKYKLSEMLPAMNLPADTTKVSMDLGNLSNSVYLSTGDKPIGAGSYCNNFVAITTDSGLTDRLSIYSEKYPSMTVNYKIDYYPASGMCDIFDQNGVKTATAAVDSVYIQFVSAAAQYGRVYYTPAGSGPSVLDIWYSPDQSRPHPFLNLTITSQTITGTPVYMDPTKGIGIKSSNLNNTIWNNEYENGIIKILFRAVETYQTYHNEFTISGNDVAVDYTDGRFSVSLNGGDPVDIGRWRNIVLDLNLENGTLTVIPVRTFNSYTNVELDTTNIPIGELVNSTTTNTIVWKPTANSFRFNIYSTDVFLDTYGAVMVNPSLDIQQYFTQLNNFYRLELRGFTVVGDSLTINGITGTTSGQNVTFNDQILSLKNLDITYADGKVTVSDGSASVDLGEIQNTVISGIGTWYFTSQLDRGFTESKQVYTWDWGDFIFNNTQFCVIFIGLIIAGLIAGRRVSSFGVVDYALMGIAIAIALTTRVIA